METLNTRKGVTIPDLECVVSPFQIAALRPFIKLSLEGILLHANNSGIDFLEMWSGYLKRPSVNYLLKEHSGILNPQCNMDICIRLYNMVYYFSVVAFHEDGYVGLYGYRTVDTGTPICWSLN